MSTRRVLAGRATRRAGAVFALLAAALLLTACDPVAALRTHPAPSAPGGTRVDTSCAATPHASGATPQIGATDRVAYSALAPGAGFTSAVAGAKGRVVQLAAGTYGFSDFVPADGTFDGAVVGPAATGLLGAGVARTTLETVPHSSTHAGDIPTTFPATNQLSVLRVTGSTSVLSGFTVLGTPQGHLYNGLRIDRLRDLRAADLRVVGIPGDDDAPPGETFGINDYKTTGSRYARIQVDGAGVGGAGFGVNGSQGITICDTVSHDNAFSMGFAFYQVRDITMTDCSAYRNGGSGFNFERVSGHVQLVRPIAHDNRWDMRIASDRGTATYTIVDPKLTDGHWTISIPRAYFKGPNLQQRSDVTLLVHGVSRPDLIRWVVP